MAIELSENTGITLRRILALTEEQPIPADVLKAAQRLKFLLDRIGGGEPNAQTLTLLVLQVGVPVPAADAKIEHRLSRDAEPAEEPEPQSEKSDVDWDVVDADTPVRLRYKDVPRTGKFVGLAGKAASTKIRVKIDGDDKAKFRTLPREDVFLADDAGE